MQIKSYSYDDIDKVRQFNDLKLACIEEPFVITTLQSYKEWKWERLNNDDWHIETPICLDESILGYDDLSYAIEYGLIDVLNIKVGRMGVSYLLRQLLIFVENVIFRIG